MADMSNRESASTDSSPLRNSAGTALLAPTFRNGCISELSSEALRGSGHDYTTAMKNYAAVYEEYQSYLMPVEQGLLHDYDLAVQPIPEFSHLGCLNADLLDSTVQGDVVSDDDIESCGYMAWVHH